MRYAVQRAAALLLTMGIVSFLAFAAFSAVSGNPAQILLGTQATPEQVEALEEALGLHRPLLIRYGAWLAGFFTGNLGVSLSYRQEVGSLIGEKILVTLALSALSFILILLFSVPLSLVTARFRSGIPAGIHLALNQFCMAFPPFFTGILLSWWFGVTLKWFTPGAFPGLENHGAWRFLLFAAAALAIPRSAMAVRMLRGTILSEWNRDYVRTAVARGNSPGRILRRHILKNALPPVVSFLAQTMAELVAGSVVIEQVFGIPGLGRMLVVSISNRDYPVVQAIVVILSFWVVLSATAADLINAWIDPRLRLKGGGA